MIQNFNGELIVHINKSKDLKIDLTLKIYNTKDVQVIANNASMVKSSLADGHGLDAVREIVDYLSDSKLYLEFVVVLIVFVKLFLIKYILIIPKENI